MAGLIERVYIFVGCEECPFAFRSRYKSYLYCRENPNLYRGIDSEHDLSNITEYPDYCWFNHNRKKNNV